MAGVVTPLAALTTGRAHAQGLAQLTNQDAAAALRDALGQGLTKAVAALGRENGFLGNAQVKIPLPESLQRIESVLRGVGMGSYADELVTRMNRAAEQAVPEARTLLVDAAKKMTIQDAKGILGGPVDSATQYLRRTTADPLAARFLPIVRKATAGVRLGDAYNDLAGRAASFGLVKPEDSNLDRYVTRKALDGLYLMVAEEEKAIRANPLAAASAIARRVFGAISR